MSFLQVPLVALAALLQKKLGLRPSLQKLGLRPSTKS